MISNHLNKLRGLHAALDNLQSFVYIKDTESKYIYANKYTLDLFNCTAENLHLIRDQQLFAPEVVEKLREIDLKVLSGQETREEITINQDSDDKKVYLEVKTPLYSETLPNLIIGILGISTDITYQKILEEKALTLAKTDALTNLINRLELDSVLNLQIEQAKRFAHPLSIIMFDIDHYKKVNDNFGHIVGDQCLVEMATILKNNARVIDTVGRWGGEEFLIICNETDLNGALNLAEKLRQAVENNQFKTVNQITGSFGVASFKAEDTLDMLINRADQALYNAKQRGRNRVASL